MSTLLVLAAGLGSRYGGMKQIDPVGPNGETILDYSVFDARRAGFSRVVFVIRREFEAIFREKIGAKYSGKIDVGYAFQSLDALPPGFSSPSGREKPWGTGHATWCARDEVKTGFAVINADDFYGADAFRGLANFLQRAAPNEGAMAGFSLANTLSESGPVSRGICDVDRAGRLLSVTERTHITLADVGAGRSYPPDTRVSMNCWAFTPEFFAPLGEELENFLRQAAPPPAQPELYLPSVVSHLIARGRLLVDVLPTNGNWFGVTYREDKPRVVAALRTLIDAGLYPENLF